MIMLGSTGISLASAQQVVNGLYQQYYNRLPTQAEAADWEGVLINGSQSVAQVSQQFATGGLQYTPAALPPPPSTTTFAPPPPPPSSIAVPPPTIQTTTSVVSGTVPSVGGQPLTGDIPLPLPNEGVGAALIGTIQGQANNSTDMFSAIGLPNLAFGGFSNDTVWLGLGAVAVLFFMMSGSHERHR